jgi:hypothetical protein
MKTINPIAELIAELTDIPEEITEYFLHIDTGIEEATEKALLFKTEWDEKGIRANDAQEIAKWIVQDYAERQQYDWSVLAFEALNDFHNINEKDILDEVMDKIVEGTDWRHALDTSQDYYYGCWPSDEDFAQDYYEGLEELEALPSAIRNNIDWHEVWETELRYNTTKLYDYYFRD